MRPVPDHLKQYDWYPAHLAWLAECGAWLAHTPPEGTAPERANLRDADLRDADLTGADLTDADLTGANLRGANLRDAEISGANLTGAVLPDGRTLDDWKVDPLAGICTESEAVQRAVDAWGGHTWQNCPMHAALGIDGLHDLDDEEKRRQVGCFVALFDGGHLPKPEGLAKAIDDDFWSDGEFWLDGQEVARG